MHWKKGEGGGVGSWGVGGGKRRFNESAIASPPPPAKTTATRERVLIQGCKEKEFAIRPALIQIFINIIGSAFLFVEQK